MEKLLVLSIASLVVGTIGFTSKIEEYALAINLVILAGMVRVIEKEGAK